MKLILNKFLASEETCCCHNQCLPPTTTTLNRNSRRLSLDAAAVISFILIFFNVIKLEICFYVSDSADKNLCSPLTSPPPHPWRPGITGPAHTCKHKYNCLAGLSVSQWVSPSSVKMIIRFSTVAARINRNTQMMAKKFIIFDLTIPAFLLAI